MSCPQCHKEILIFADFCPYCGAGVTPHTAGRREFWEYCEIKPYSLFGGDATVVWYQADAVGREGIFKAGESIAIFAFYGGQVEGDSEAQLPELVNTLLRAGWQQVSGEQFKRRAQLP